VRRSLRIWVIFTLGVIQGVQGGETVETSEQDVPESAIAVCNNPPRCGASHTAAPDKSVV